MTAPLCRCTHRMARHVHRNVLGSCELCDCDGYRRHRRESRPVETAEYGAFAVRVIRAYANRVGDRDIEALAGLADIQRHVDAALRLSVANLHAQGYSWTDIGRVLGVSRQAAQQRFGRDVE